MVYSEVARCPRNSQHRRRMGTQSGPPPHRRTYCRMISYLLMWTNKLKSSRSRHVKLVEMKGQMIAQSPVFDFRNLC